MNQSQPITGNATPSFRVPNGYIRYLRFLEFLSFSLAAREVRNRFFTPIPFATPEREQTFLKRARLETMVTGGRQISLHHMDLDGPVVVFIHGWSGRGSQAYALAPELHKGGFHVIAVTAQAHGQNPGKRTHMLQFTDALMAVCENYRPYAVVAHSIGGAAAFNALARGLNPEKLAILGAPSSISEVIDDFCKRLTLDKRYGDYLRKYLRKNYEEDFEKLSPRRRAADFPHVKGLIVHDKNDIDVHYEQAVALHEHWENSELILTEGLGHRRILSDERVIRTLLDFLSENPSKS